MQLYPRTNEPSERREWQTPPSTNIAETTTEETKISWTSTTFPPVYNVSSIEFPLRCYFGKHNFLGSYVLSILILISLTEAKYLMMVISCRKITRFEGDTSQAISHGIEGGEFVRFGAEGITKYHCMGGRGFLNTPNSWRPLLIEMQK